MNTCISSIVNCFKSLFEKKQEPQITYEQIITEGVVVETNEQELLNTITNVLTDSVVLAKIDDSIMSLPEVSNTFIPNNTETTVLDVPVKQEMEDSVMKTNDMLDEYIVV